MREFLDRIEQTLTIPAAEYVPAIGDVFTIIDEARKALDQSALQQQPEPVAPLPDDGFIWMTHPSRFDGKPLPVWTYVQRGVRYYVPFDHTACDFEWDERDVEWQIIVPPALQHQEVPREPVAPPNVEALMPRVWAMAVAHAEYVSAPTQEKERARNEAIKAVKAYAQRLAASPSTTQQQGVGSEAKAQALEVARLFRQFTKSSHRFYDGRPLHVVAADLLELLAAAPSTPENAGGVPADHFPEARKMIPDGVTAPPLPASDEALEALIEDSGGYWKEDVFCIEGGDLMNLLRAASTPGVPAAREPLPAETAQPMFASHVGRRKWESLQGDGYRMQRIHFARSVDGHERRGTIDPWGKVLWEPAGVKEADRA